MPGPDHTAEPFVTLARGESCSWPANSWLKGAALYQVYPLSFADANGDGYGDLPGVLAHLDHIAGLGVDALWLSPFYPSPLADFGYDVTDHRAVDPRMGTLGDFDRLVEAAHGRGLRVMLDLICGHTSDRHPWFAASRRSRGAATADWYVWADPAPDGTPPNNWLSVFGGSAWSWEPRRRQYYLHHFLSCQPALNLHDDDVVGACCETARFWLDRGVDGFRLDAVDFLLHDRDLTPNPPRPDRSAPVPSKPFGMQRHLHDMIQPGIGGVIQRLAAAVAVRPGRVLLGELSSQPGAAARIAHHTANQPAGGGLDAAYTLALAKAPLTPEAFRPALEACAEGARICWSFSNHDVERAASRWLPEGADPGRFDALLACLFASLPGTICLYQGEELGLPEAELAEADLRDPFGIAFWPEFKGRDGSRTPFPWSSDAPGAGFTTDAARSWLPVPASHRPLALDRQQGRPDAPLAVHRAAFAWRRDHPALRHGSVTVLPQDGPVLAFGRAAPGERLLLAFNLSITPAGFAVPAGSAWTSLPVPANAALPAGRHVGAGDRIALPPLGVLMLRQV